MLWILHILVNFYHSCESRNPEVCSQAEIWIPDPCFRGDKFSEDDIYTRMLILLKIYVELRLIIMMCHAGPGSSWSRIIRHPKYRLYIPGFLIKPGMTRFSTPDSPV